MNNCLKIISVHDTPLFSMGGFFPKKKLFMREQKRFLAKKLWGGCCKLEE